MEYGNLVLSRRLKESIVIAKNIEVRVEMIGPKQVKLSVRAPTHVRVDRKEISKKVEAEQTMKGWVE